MNDDSTGYTGPPRPDIDRYLPDADGVMRWLTPEQREHEQAVFYGRQGLIPVDRFTGSARARVETIARIEMEYWDRRMRALQDRVNAELEEQEQNELRHARQARHTRWFSGFAALAGLAAIPTYNMYKQYSETRKAKQVESHVHREAEPTVRQLQIT